ncbi:MAG: alcohol dehydrogenase family protein [Sedimenticola sp.]
MPEAGPFDVLVRVAAAGVNNTDINSRVGWYSKSDNSADDASWAGSPLHFPLIQGIDVCGTIVSVGERVNRDRIGERVLVEPCIREADGKGLAQPWFLGSECNGGFAEYVAVPSKHAYPVESDYTDAELASFPCSYSTAENLLTRSDVRQGERVLVTGASGGVGSAAVQLAKARGAYVIAVTSRSKQEAVQEIGADKVVLRESSLVETLGLDHVDVVVDLVGGEQWPELLDILKPGGRYAVSGAIAGPMVQLDLRTLYLKDLSFFGCTSLEPEIFQNLVSHIQNKRIVPLVAKTFPLEEIRQAQAEFQEKKHIGKFVLTVNTH